MFFNGNYDYFRIRFLGFKSEWYIFIKLINWVEQKVKLYVSDNIVLGGYDRISRLRYDVFIIILNDF